MESIIDRLQKDSIERIKEFIDFPNSICAVHPPAISEHILHLNAVPTGLVMKGYFSPKNDPVFLDIKRYCFESQHAIAIIESKNVQTLKQAFVTIIEQLMDSLPDPSGNSMPLSKRQRGESDQSDTSPKKARNEHVESDASESEETEVMDEDVDGEDNHVEDDQDIQDYIHQFQNQPKGNVKLAKYDPLMLHSWYKHRKQSAPMSIRQMVIVFQDLEAFDPELVIQITGILSESYPALPLVFLFGMATSAETVHQMLPRSLIRKLRFNKFKLQQSTDIINEILEELFLKQTHGLKIGELVFGKLLDDFKLYTLSVPQFMNTLQVCAVSPFSLFIFIY